jgi:hypothetical protein
MKMSHLRIQKMDVDPLEFLSGRCWTGMITILQLAKETGLEEDEVQPQTRIQWRLPQWMLKQCGADPGLSGADPIATIVAGLPGFIAEEIATVTMLECMAYILQNILYSTLYAVHGM